jgi:outer membrane lipopolysaccharide assembly protein LptE/RlpB
MTKAGLKMKRYFNGSIFLLIALFTSAAFSTGCGIYSFSEKSPKALADSIKTVNVRIIENEAPYRNPQLSPNLTDRLKQKINNQTKLSQTNSEDAHWIIEGTIREYSVTTSGITSANGQSQTSVNRLTVSVAVTVIDTRNREGEPKQYTVTRQFDFGASQSLQQAEAGLLDEMVRNLADEIFNRLFSDW